MKHTKTILVSFVLCAAIWTAFSWPLPRHLFEAIPSSAHNEETQAVRPMIPGDHLQLMYHFWLLGDAIRGNSPWFHNIYEFNRGDDSESYNPLKTYYIPFSISYVVGEVLAGQAFGWNFSGFLSLWLSFLGMYWLARRYTVCPVTAMFAAAVAFLLPYRWVSLFGGSPSAHSMMWIPYIWLGLDLAIRDGAWKGGLLAGVASFMLLICDTQIYFFAALSMPCWCIIAMLRHDEFKWLSWSSYTRILKGFGPLIVVLIPSIFYLFEKQKRFIGSDMAGGRSWREVSIYSPRVRGLYSWGKIDVSNHAFIGYVLVTVLLVAALVLLVQCFRKKQSWRDGCIMVLLLAGGCGIVSLALGTRGPWDGAVLKVARGHVPNYNMIRQTTKIYCLMQPLITVLLVLGCGALFGLIATRKKRLIALVALAVLFFAEYKHQIHPAICLLDDTQGAYAAVSADADETSTKKHAIVVPLWPGNSAWSSLYEHYISLYGIRMVNGYHPVVKDDYYDNIFRYYESINKGAISDEQIAGLHEMGVNYVILHENAFPEKVSPFAVSFTLQNLLSHDRLQFLENENGIWSFRIVDQADHENVPDWAYQFPSRQWEAERCVNENVTDHRSAQASSGVFLALEQPGGLLKIRGTHTIHADDMRLAMRLKGDGIISVRTLFNEETLETVRVPVRYEDWTWVEQRVKPFEGHGRLKWELEQADGRVDIDMSMLMAGPWDQLAVGESIELPAAIFFHGGEMDLERESVVLKKERIPSANVFYGPKMPLDPGSYEVALNYQTPAAEGTQIGAVKIETMGLNVGTWQPVVAGEAAVVTLEHVHNLPINLIFRFDWIDDVEISSVEVRKR